MNYTQNVFFTVKDSLTSGDPAKVIRGTEFDGEFAEIAASTASKEDTANRGVASGYAPLDASVFVPIANLPVVTAAKGGTGRSTLTANNVLAGNGTGTVNLLAPGAAGQVLRSTGSVFASAALIAADIPSLDTAKITTGTFADARIPSLDAGKITTGAFADARIPALDAGKTTTGTFADARIPSLAASKITSGTFAIARIPTGTLGTQVALGNHTHAYLPLSGGTVTGAILRSGVGAHVWHGAAGNSSGVITVSTAAPSGGANGDIWMRY